MKRFALIASITFVIAIGFFVVFLLRNVAISKSIKLLYIIRQDKEEGKV